MAIKSHNQKKVSQQIVAERLSTNPQASFRAMVRSEWYMGAAGSLSVGGRERHQLSRQLTGKPHLGQQIFPLMSIRPMRSLTFSPHLMQNIGLRGSGILNARRSASLGVGFLGCSGVSDDMTLLRGRSAGLGLPGLMGIPD